MKQINKQTDIRRRKFLRNTLAGGAGTALLATAPGIALASTPDAPADTDSSNKGYRLTQHIADYYKTATS